MRSKRYTTLLLLLVVGSLFACGKTTLRGSQSVGGDSSHLAAGEDGHGYQEGDDDGDRPLHGPDSDDPRHFGAAATDAEVSAVSALVEDYYTAGLRGDATAACRFLSRRLRTNPKLGTMEEEMYPPPLSLPPLSGATCGRIVSVLFREAHTHAAAAIKTVKVILLRVDAHQGMAFLGFRALPERLLKLEREGRRWRLAELLDSELP